MTINIKYILFIVWLEVKKLLKIFGWNFLGFYMAYIVFFLVENMYKPPFFQSPLPDILFFGVIASFIFSLYPTITLYLFSFLDKRLLKWWFGFGTGMYCLIIGLLNQTKSIWFIVSIELISFIIVLFVLNSNKIINKFKVKL